MRAGNRFCGNCGHQLTPAGRFCSKCGRDVSAPPGRGSAQEGEQNLAATPQQISGLTTVSVQPTPRSAAPPGPEPLGTRPPWPGPPARAARRPSYLLPLVVALAVFVVAGGSAVTVFMIRQSHGHPAVRDKLAAITPASAPPSSFSPSAPPTQVTVDGTMINIAAISTDPAASAVANTLGTYFGGIDSRNYQQAWAAYSAALQAAIPLQPLSKALSTSQDSEIVVQSIEHDANGDIDADVSFQSHQAGPYGPSPGETCTNWSLDYHLVPGTSEGAGQVSLSYLIDEVTDIGPGHSSC
jgi:hypothetical protein